jgi:hypothetical protein
LVRDGLKALGVDLLEGMNNTLKRLAEQALRLTAEESIVGGYVRDVHAGFKRAARESGPADGAKLFAWIRGGVSDYDNCGPNCCACGSHRQVPIFLFLVQAGVGFPASTYASIKRGCSASCLRESAGTNRISGASRNKGAGITPLLIPAPKSSRTLPSSLLTRARNSRRSWCGVGCGARRFGPTVRFAPGRGPDDPPPSVA